MSRIRVPQNTEFSFSSIKENTSDAPEASKPSNKDRAGKTVQGQLVHRTYSMTSLYQSELPMLNERLRFSSMV